MKRFVALFLSVLLLASLFPGSAAALSEESNRFNFLTSYCGYPNASGVNTFSECYQTSSFISAHEGDTVTAGPFRNGQPVYITVYANDKKTVIRQITSLSDLTDIGELNGAGFIKSFPIPAGGAYVRVTLGAEYYNTFRISVNDPFTVQDYLSLTESLGLTRYLDFIRADKSRFGGRNLVAVGDSVGHGSYESAYEGANKSAVRIAFAGRVKNLLDFASYANYAMGGASFSDKNANRILSQIQANANAYTEFLLIEGGIVDMFGYNNTVVPIGYLSDSFDPATFAPESTFIGGLERCLYAATTQSPNAVIAFLIPYSVKVAYGGRFGWERMFRFIPIVCEKWGVPVIDLYNNEAVNQVMSCVSTIGPNVIFYDNAHCTPLTYTACSLETAMAFYNLPKYNVNNRKLPTDIPSDIAKDTWKMPDAGNPPIRINLAENLWTGQNTTTYLNSSYSKPFVTSDFIAVKPGDVLTLGPCSPYCLRQVQGFSDTKRDVTGFLDDMHLALVSVLTSGRLILQYTVPEGVGYVKVAFQEGSGAPVVTNNKPFDGPMYTEWLTAALTGKPVVFPATPVNVTTLVPAVTQAPVTTPVVPVTTIPNDTHVPVTEAPETSSAMGTTEAVPETGGCGSVLISCAAVLPLSLSCLMLRRKRKKED